MSLWRLHSPLPMVYQSQAGECGLACMAMVCAYHGCDIDMRELRARFGPGLGGSSVRALLRAADRLALRGRSIKLELEEIDKLITPAILHWDMDHFVVLRRVGRGKITVHDPARGIREYRYAELGNHFTGIAVELARQGEVEDQETRRSSRAPLTLKRLLPRRPELTAAIPQILFFSLLLQSLSLLAPLYLQLVVDQGLSRGDVELIFVLAGLFALLAMARVMLLYARGVLTMNLTSNLGFELVSNTFRHLLSLPLSYFERREMGDIVSRFSSLENVKRIVTQEMVTVVVDGLFSILTIVLLYLYQPVLAAVVLVFTVIYTLSRLLTLRAEKSLRQETLESDASQHTQFMESVQRIATIKLNEIEADRETSWQEKYTRFLQSGLRLAHLQLGLTSWQTFLFTSENILTIYLGAQYVYAGQLSLGQLMSFIFLKQHFTGSVTALLPKLSEIRLLRLDLERVGEIISEPTERHGLQLSLMSRPPVRNLRVDKLCYRYSESESAIIDALSFEMPPGCICVITGPSGSGKSTLLQLMLGLRRADSGEILINDKHQGDTALRQFSQQISVSLHNDDLLSGDLAFNINMGVEPFAMERLRDACRRAEILELIESLPQGFASKIGEMGSFLSAGQSRRVLLARAFYKKPSLFIMDETLIHLGKGAPGRILANIRELNASALIVSHDDEVIAAADRVVKIGAADSKHGSY